MAEETLLSAARRVVRDFNIDMGHGGLIQPSTQHSIETLDRMVRIEVAREKLAAQNPTNMPDDPVGERATAPVSTL